MEQVQYYPLRHFIAHPINWDLVPHLALDHYPWYEAGEKEQSLVQVALGTDVTGLHGFHIHGFFHDTTISAHCTEQNGPVYKDSCFECFFIPNEKDLNSGLKAANYFNIEVNCCGTIYMAYGNGVVDQRVPLTDDQIKRVHVRTSVPGPTKDLFYKDSHWEIAIHIPFDLLVEVAGAELSLTTWYANFYRCGGDANPQYASWEPIQWPYPNYHLPQFFGPLKIEQEKE